MRHLAGLVALLALTACKQDPATPLTGAWHLQSDPSVTFEIDDDLNFFGAAPCNRYFGRFEILDGNLRSGPIGATLMACPKLDQEYAYFKALEASRSAVVQDGLLVLRSAEGASLVFTPQP